MVAGPVGAEALPMQFDVFSKPLAQLQVDCLVVGIHLGNDDRAELGDDARLLDRASDGALAKLLGHGDFPGRAGETLLVPGLPKVKASRVLLVGQGRVARCRVAAGARRCTRPSPRSRGRRSAVPPWR
jgi:hypothetical protein